ncbi:lysylphosphatidylglycerol synthase domain-containing protein, partial [Streptomyces olivaceus]
ARSVHGRPARALALWGGALAFPALQASALVLVGRSLGLPVPAAHMAVAYLAATVAVALVPTPGGIGSVEAALVVALVATGGPAAVATAVVLAFRLLTVWLPLLPGALTLAALVRMRVI